MELNGCSVLQAARWSGRRLLVVQPTESRIYSVLSLIGDKISVVAHEMTAGSNMDRNRHDTITLNDRVLDNTTVLAASNAVKRLDARATTVLLVSSDPQLYELQDRLFDRQDPSIALLESIKKMLHSQNATYLILITKYRGEAMLRLRDVYVGSGKIEGVGFYMDATLPTRRSDTHASGAGFLAPFAYIRVMLVDARTMAVIREQKVEESTTLSTARATGSLRPWDVLTSAQKVSALQDVISKSIGRAMPNVLEAK